MKSAVPAESERHRITRLKERAAYDRASVNAVLDAALVAHVGFVHAGLPVVIPMAVWRDGDYLYIHSANKGRLASVCAGANLCVSVVHVDGLVLARSAFNHSMNYRSLVVHGVAEAVTDDAAKLQTLKAFMERLFPGRWDQLRPVKANELQATVVLRVSLECASVKARTGTPGDAAEDPEWPVWCGVWPVTTQFGAAQADPAMSVALPTPEYLLRGDEPLTTEVTPRPQKL
jgi:nitroimidazol reductase NimA-like FMN-containing flavoprotein (pyridoxamine 5'-phosphate oxidase superfamily)